LLKEQAGARIAALGLGPAEMVEKYLKTRSLVGDILQNVGDNSAPAFDFAFLRSSPALTPVQVFLLFECLDKSRLDDVFMVATAKALADLRVNSRRGRIGINERSNRVKDDGADWNRVFG